MSSINNKIIQILTPKNNTDKIEILKKLIKHFKVEEYNNLVNQEQQRNINYIDYINITNKLEDNIILINNLKIGDIIGSSKYTSVFYKVIGFTKCYIKAKQLKPIKIGKLYDKDSSIKFYFNKNDTYEDILKFKKGTYKLYGNIPNKYNDIYIYPFDKFSFVRKYMTKYDTINVSDILERELIIQSSN